MLLLVVCGMEVVECGREGFESALSPLHTRTRSRGLILDGEVQNEGIQRGCPFLVRFVLFCWRRTYLTMRGIYSGVVSWARCIRS
ncbi:hypothetical protein C7J99_03395 [Brevibacillus brevis]|nr:hypothetical protein C7J99_03395 [Brevibacillus brevis]